ncbi:hypothetical protein HNY73_002172 [Argiope bruennichi]|uniref:Uncharacterized protein n=1 Tax=Argiope bruennichi TaxID=94029 RepID=A0A8T0FV62_ARGBR|nr:hypothetical protein HNY73_002172 [Argiope bruennichi]
MATGAPKESLYLVPSFTSDRWSDGIYDTETSIVSPSLVIKEDDLLTFDQREERETRSLVFEYQFKYAEKEYELLKKEFKNIEAKLSRQGASAAEHPFKEPKGVKKPSKTRDQKSTSESETEKDQSISPRKNPSRLTRSSKKP